MQLHTHSTGSSARHRIVSPTRADCLRAAKRARLPAAGSEPAASAVHRLGAAAGEDGAGEDGAGEGDDAGEGDAGEGDAGEGGAGEGGAGERGDGVGDGLEVRARRRELQTGRQRVSEAGVGGQCDAC